MASAASWDAKLAEAKQLAKQATELELARAYSSALQAYYNAGEKYLWLIANVPARPHGAPGHGQGQGQGSSEATRAQLNATLKKLIARAELIKKTKKDAVRAPRANPLSEEAQSAVLARSSSVNGSKLPLWTDDPEPFDLAALSLQERASSGADADEDDAHRPALSRDQLAHGATYRRPRYAAAPGVSAGAGASAPAEGSADGAPARTIYALETRAQDIVQDVVSDCSLVAALEAMALHDWRFRTQLAPSCLYPKGADGLPSARAARGGVYLARLHVNGIFRRVRVRDALPHASDGALICARTLDDRLLLPALVEKAYLQALGGAQGYDFAGSNPAQDLHVLLGWIPEHVHLRGSAGALGVGSADGSLLEARAYRGEAGWRRLYAAWNQRGCIITAGSGSSLRASAGPNLVPGHAYCVIDMYEEPAAGGEPSLPQRFVTLLNPWHEDKIRQVQPGGQRAFTLEWDAFTAQLDSLFLNWDPARWPHDVQLHLAWEPSSDAAANPSPGGEQAAQGAENSQNVSTFPLLLTVEREAGQEGALVESADDDLCVLLVRHVKSRDDEQERKRHVTLRLAEQRGGGGGSSTSGIGNSLRHAQTSWVDSTHLVAKRRVDFRTGSKCTFQLQAACLGRPPLDDAFSLFVYSRYKVAVSKAAWDLPYEETIEGEWSGKSAGGSSLHSTFMHNPQYAVQVQPDAASPVSSLRVTLRSARQDVRMNAQLLWAASAPGARVAAVAPGQVVGSSGAYDNRVVQFECADLKPGAYTLILSTYEPQLEAGYTLQVACSSRVEIKPIAPEGAGLFARTLRGAWSTARRTAAGAPSHGSYTQNPKFLLQLGAPGRCLVRLQIADSGDAQGGARVPPINVSIFERSGAADIGRQVATSGPYDDALCGVLAESARLEAGEYVVVASTYTPATEAGFVLHCYAQGRLQVSPM